MILAVALFIRALQVDNFARRLIAAVESDVPKVMVTLWAEVFSEGFGVVNYAYYWCGCWLIVFGLSRRHRLNTVHAMQRCTRL